MRIVIGLVGFFLAGCGDEALETADEKKEVETADEKKTVESSTVVPVSRGMEVIVDIIKSGLEGAAVVHKCMELMTLVSSDSQAEELTAEAVGRGLLTIDDLKGIKKVDFQMATELSGGKPAEFFGLVIYSMCEESLYR
jgi:hypothetical protein